MFDDYKMFRSGGIGPIGSTLMSLYLLAIAGPILMAADWYGRNHVGETGFEFDDDFDGDVEFIEDSPFGGELKKFEGPAIVDENDLINCPPVGSPEWDEWIDKKV